MSEYVGWRFLKIAARHRLLTSNPQPILDVNFDRFRSRSVRRRWDCPPPSPRTHRPRPRLIPENARTPLAIPQRVCGQSDI